MQARTFDTADRNRVLRAVIATMQDYGYGLNRVSSEAGTVTATKAAQLRLTASVYPRGETQTVVRANAFALLPAVTRKWTIPPFTEICSSGRSAALFCSPPRLHQSARRMRRCRQFLLKSPVWANRASPTTRYGQSPESLELLRLKRHIGEDEQLNRMISRLLALSLTICVAVGCASASQHAVDVAQAQEVGTRLTVGTVQREIRVGMSNAQVAEVLGAPNVVTTDDLRRETWAYDRISTQTAYSGSSGGVNALFLAGVGGRAGAVSTSQRTLTVIIRFDETGRLRDFSYRSSSF